MVNNWKIQFYTEMGEKLSAPIYVGATLYAKEAIIQAFNTLSKANQEAAVYVDVETQVTLYPLKDYIQDGS